MSISEPNAVTEAGSPAEPGTDAAYEEDRQHLAELLHDHTPDVEAEAAAAEGRGDAAAAAGGPPAPGRG